MYVLLDALLFLVGVVSGKILFYNLMSPKAEKVEPLRNFICPYCENVVTGLEHLDRAMHVACIAMSQEDIAKAKKKAPGKEDKYYVTYDHYTSYTHKPGEWMYVDYKYHQYVVIVYRNGKQIEEEVIGTCSKRTAEEKAKDIIAIDKDARASGNA